jgi:2-polyprenyl-6-methoxyphenol hydroxylase-like FAD-dependent oxidoreductase
MLLQGSAVAPRRHDALRSRARIAPPACHRLAVRAAAATTSAPAARQLGDTAIVIGASVAGLLSAAALSPHFAHVLVLDRDASLPGSGADGSAAAPAPRRGVPQSSQPHVLFARGAQLLASFFPGVGTELEAEGALPVDWPAEFRCFAGGAWVANAPLPAAGAAPGELSSWTCSRFVLETVLRRRAAALPNVRWRTGARVAGFIPAAGADADAAAGAVGGVVLSDGTRIAAALTVNASGRGSNAAAWLAAAGVPPAACAPAVDSVDAGLRYATRIFTRAPDAPPLPWKVLLVTHEPPAQRRLGYVAQLEGRRLVATLGGYERDAPPLDAAGWAAFAASLPGHGAFASALAGATPDDADAVAHSATANIKRVHPPVAGMVHIGDAALALCPAYGQGMTTAALGASALRDALAAAASASTDADAAAALAALPCALAAPLAAAGAPAWALATGQDAAFPSAAILRSDAAAAPPAKRTLPPPLAWYLNALRRRATVAPEAWTALLSVSHMMRGPEALFAPGLVADTLAAEALAAAKRALRGA